MVMSKKTFFHIDHDTTKAGRSINALLSLLTANRYALILTIKLTIVKRHFVNDPMKRSIWNRIYLAVVLAPITLTVALCFKHCSEPSAGQAVRPLPEAQSAHPALLHSTNLQGLDSIADTRQTVFYGVCPVAPK